MISLKTFLSLALLNMASVASFATVPPMSDATTGGGLIEEAKIESDIVELSSRVHKHNYVPIKYTVTNKTDKPYHSKLIMNDGYGSGSAATQLFSVTTPPFGKKVYYFYPTFNSDYANINTTDNPPAHGYLNNTYLEVTLAVSTECREPWNGALSGASGVSSDFINITDWPADYRTFACFDFLIIPEKQYNNKLDESYRKAIRLWVAAGGHLLLIGDSSATESTKSYGHGKMSIAPERMNMDEDVRVEWFRKLAGLASKITYYDGSSEVTDKYIKKKFPNIDGLNKYQTPPPPVFLGLILLAFAIFVGPICLKVLAPVGKRARLFYIIPISALAVSLLLALLIFVIDGTGGVGERKVQLVINAADHTGLISQTQVVRTNLLLADEFNLSEEVAISGERNIDDYNKSLKGFQREDEVCSGGYFPSRSSVIHYLSQPVVTRWALRVEKTSDGKYSFQSSFPANLSNVTYTAEDGKVWMVKSLLPGQKLTAESVKYTGKFKPTSGSFRAIMADKDGKTGVIPTLDSIEWKKTEIIVSGPIALNN